MQYYPLIHNLPVPLADLERHTEFYNIFNRHDAAEKGIVKIINNTNLQAGINFWRQYLSGCYMRPLEEQPAVPPNFISSLPPTLVPVIEDLLSPKIRFDYLTTTMAVIGGISAALCGRFKIHLGNDWNEPVCLYIAIIAPSGSNKTALIKRILAPITEVMEPLQAKYDQAAPKQRYMAKHMQALFDKKVAHDARAKVKETKGSGADDFTRLMQWSKEYCESTAPTREKIGAKIPGARPSLMPGNFSPIGLMDALVAQGGHQACIDDEDIIFGKINSVWKENELELLLKGYDQTSYPYTRPKNQIVIEHPSLNFLVAVHPNMAVKFFAKEAHKGSGLAFRFMPILAAPGQSNNQHGISFNRRALDQLIRQQLEKNFTQNLKRELHTLGMEHKAVELLHAFRDKNRAEVASMPHMDGFLQKLTGMAGRIAGVLHLWEFSRYIPVSLKTVESAIMIANAVIPHADEIFSPSGIAATNTAYRIQEWFKKTDNVSAKIRDVNQGIGSDVNKLDIERGFARLIKCGRAVQIFDADNHPVYVINPKIMFPSPAFSPFGTMPQAIPYPMMSNQMMIPYNGINILG